MATTDTKSDTEFQHVALERHDHASACQPRSRLDHESGDLRVAGSADRERRKRVARVRVPAAGDEHELRAEALQRSANSSFGVTTLNHFVP